MRCVITKTAAVGPAPLELMSLPLCNLCEYLAKPCASKTVRPAFEILKLSSHQNYQLTYARFRIERLFHSGFGFELFSMWRTPWKPLQVPFCYPSLSFQFECQCSRALNKPAWDSPHQWKADSKHSEADQATSKTNGVAIYNDILRCTATYEKTKKQTETIQNLFNTSFMFLWGSELLRVGDLTQWHRRIWRILEECNIFHGDWLISVLLSACFHAMSLRC